MHASTYTYINILTNIYVCICVSITFISNLKYQLGTHHMTLPIACAILMLQAALYKWHQGCATPHHFAPLAHGRENQIQGFIEPVLSVKLAEKIVRLKIWYNFPVSYFDFVVIHWIFWYFSLLCFIQTYIHKDFKSSHHITLICRIMNYSGHIDNWKLIFH